MSKVPRHQHTRELKFNRVLNFAIRNAQNVAFLDMIYEMCCGGNHREIAERQLNELTQLRSPESTVVVKWLHDHGYTFPASMMDAAAKAGNLELVRFLHKHGTAGYNSGAIDDAAQGGHLDVVSSSTRTALKAVLRALSSWRSSMDTTVL